MTAAWREKPLRATDRDKEMLMGDYFDILEELENAAESSRNMCNSIEYELYDMRCDLETLENHLARCMEKLRVFQPVKSLFDDDESTTYELPFDTYE